MASRFPKLAATVVFVLLATAASVGSALDLRVQGRSRLGVDLDAAGTRIVARGELRDDLGQPLPQRAVRLEVYAEPSGRRRASRTARTDRAGRFGATFDLRPGSYRVSAVFDSTQHLTGARLEKAVAVERAPVELSVRGPDFVRGDAAPVFVRVSATVEGTGLAVPVVISGGDGEPRQMNLDASGRLRVDVSDMLGFGENRIAATIPGSKYRERSEATVVIRKFRDLEIDARVEAVFERLQRGAAVDGAIRAGDSPLDGIEVEVRLAPANRSTAERASDGPKTRPSGRAQSDATGELLERVETDEQGEFHAFFGRDSLPDGQWRARVRVTPDVGESVGESVGTIEIDRTISRMIVNGAAALALLAVLFVGLREVWEWVSRKLQANRRRRAERKRRERAFEQDEPLEPKPTPNAAPERSGGAVDRATVRGYIWNAWRSEPVEGATVHMRGEDEQAREDTSDQQGAFEFAGLEAGTWELEVSAEYFVRGRFEFDIPHDGRLAECRFELVPVALKIRRLFESLVELARGEKLWGKRSPNEMRSAIEGVLRGTAAEIGGEPGPFVRRVQRLVRGDAQGLETGVDYLEALTDIVQEVYFSPRRYDEETWAVARRIALRLREEIEARTDE